MRDPDTIRRVSELEDQMRRLTDLIRIEALPPLRLQRDYGTGLSLAIDATALQAGNVLFIRVYANDGGSPPAYAWQEQYQLTPGVWIDNPLGANGSTTNQPAYVDDGATILPALPSGSLCRAVLHSGGVYWDAWPVLVPPTYSAFTFTPITPKSGNVLGQGEALLYTTVDNGNGTRSNELTSTAVTIYNDCDAIIAGENVFLFREPNSGILKVIPLCQNESSACPCTSTQFCALFTGVGNGSNTCGIGHDADCSGFISGVTLTYDQTYALPDQCLWTGLVSVCDTFVENLLVVLVYSKSAGVFINLIVYDQSTPGIFLASYPVVSTSANPYDCKAPLTASSKIVGGGTSCITFPSTVSITVGACSGSGSGSGSGGTGCCAGACGDAGVPASVMATVTAKMGVYTTLPNTFSLTCYNSTPGFHGFQNTSLNPEGGSNIYCKGDTGIPYFINPFDATVTYADGGYTCSPFSAVFHVNDGSGNSAIFTVIG